MRLSIPSPRRLMLWGGLSIVVVTLSVELRPNASAGIGPYQAVIIFMGLALAGLGGFQLDTLPFQVSLTLFSICIMLIVLESTAPTIQNKLPPVQTSTIPDDWLGSRVRPNFSGHDARGWRNETALETASIVAIGDSQTWGVNATINQTWPAALSQLVEQPVYNMARGGYGPIQYEYLIQEALTLDPEIIVVGLYFGNDIADAYNLVYGNENYSDRHQLSSQVNSPGYSISGRASQLMREYQLNESQILNRYTSTSFLAKVRYHTAIGRLIEARSAWPDWLKTTAQLDDFIPQIQADRDSFPFPIYIDDTHVTLFTPEYRWVALRLDDPRIAEGLRLTKDALATMQGLADEHDFRLLVLLIPTKERVYAEALTQHYGVLPDDFQQLLAAEAEVHQNMVSFLSANDIHWVDSLPYLRENISQSLYLPATDGHPNANGYRVLAEVVAEALTTND